MPPCKDDEFARWDALDELLAHGLSIEIKADEMQSLMRCRCKMPNYDVLDMCAVCNRRKPFTSQDGAGNRRGTLTS